MDENNNYDGNKFPRMMWSQTKTFVFVAIEIHHVQNYFDEEKENKNIKCDPYNLHVDITNQETNEHYVFDLPFEHEIDCDENDDNTSSYYKDDCCFILKIKKKYPQYWSYLVSNESYLKPYIINHF